MHDGRILPTAIRCKGLYAFLGATSEETERLQAHLVPGQLSHQVPAADLPANILRQLRLLRSKVCTLHLSAFVLRRLRLL